VNLRGQIAKLKAARAAVSAVTRTRPSATTIAEAGESVPPVCERCGRPGGALILEEIASSPRRPPDAVEVS
jgi:hypothetical protein